MPTKGHQGRRTDQPGQDFAAPCPGNAGRPRCGHVLNWHGRYRDRPRCPACGHYLTEAERRAIETVIEAR